MLNYQQQNMPQFVHVGNGDRATALQMDAINSAVAVSNAFAKEQAQKIAAKQAVNSMAELNAQKNVFDIEMQKQQALDAQALSGIQIAGNLQNTQLQGDLTKQSNEQIQGYNIINKDIDQKNLIAGKEIQFDYDTKLNAQNNDAAMKRLDVQYANEVKLIEQKYANDINNPIKKRELELELAKIELGYAEQANRLKISGNNVLVAEIQSGGKNGSSGQNATTKDLSKTFVSSVRDFNPLTKVPVNKAKTGSVFGRKERTIAEDIVVNKIKSDENIVAQYIGDNFPHLTGGFRLSEEASKQINSLATNIHKDLAKDSYYQALTPDGKKAYFTNILLDTMEVSGSRSYPFAKGANKFISNLTGKQSKAFGEEITVKVYPNSYGHAVSAETEQANEKRVDATKKYSKEKSKLLLEESQKQKEYKKQKKIKEYNQKKTLSNNALLFDEQMKNVFK